MVMLRPRSERAEELARYKKRCEAGEPCLDHIVLRARPIERSALVHSAG
jgi:hypothetical protein